MMRAFALASLVVSACALGACASTQQVSALDQDGCTTCHTNLTNAHAKAIVLCTDCHGKNAASSQSSIDDLIGQFKGAAAQRGDNLYQQLLDQMHVHPKQPELFLANGLTGSQGACFNAGADPACNAANPALNGLGTVDDAIDSEYARDLNYLRFVNPGDLRVAQAGCGGASRGAGEYGGCHTEEVRRMRRSIMAANASVVTAAFIGNRGRLQEGLGGTRQAGTNIDPRGYVFDLDGPNGVDSCFDAASNSYTASCLSAHKALLPVDDQTTKLDPSNDTQEAFPGRVNALPVSDLPSGTTLPHSGFATRIGGYDGTPLVAGSHPHDHIDPPDSRANASVTLPDVASGAFCKADPDGRPLPANTLPTTATIEPVDAILRGFRAYYPLWLPGSGKNFNAVAGSTLDPTVSAFNPFGRGHGSGCTGCHMLYDADGKSHETGDPTLQEAGRFPSTDLVDNAPAAQQGMNVRQELGGDDHKQQRFYPSRHRITTRIPTRQCGLCHTFVTRIDLTYTGIAEIEEGDVLARADAKNPRPGAGEIVFNSQTPDGLQSRVHIYDALERVQSFDGGKTFKITTPATALQQRALLADACKTLGRDCSETFSADFNNNGVLDADEPDLNGGELFLPDRIPREASVDGRQARILYGGASGAERMQDVHFQKGMQCIDCHFYQDLHGDGNIYTNNWDQIEIECEDCHGFSKTRAWEPTPGKLLTSGPNGGNNLFGAKDDFGKPFFEIRKNDAGVDQLMQHSRVTPGVEWVVPQVADVNAPTPDAQNPNSNPHSDKHLPTGPREGGKLECYSCHNTFAMNCLSCHYQQNYRKQQKEVFLAGTTQQSKTNFQLFGMIRGPLILGVNGDAEEHRLSPFRSSMEAYVSLADCNGNTILGNVVHSNCRDGVRPVSGVGMNNFMPHSVRGGAARGCETCHTALNAAGNQVNNHILSQTLGLGTGRLNYMGDWLFVAAANSLDVVDVKNESELPADDTGPRNSFPGFQLGNRDDKGLGAAAKALVRSYAHAAAGTPLDVVLLRGLNGTLCTAEKALNPDLAITANGTALQIFNVTAPDLRTNSNNAVLVPSTPITIVGTANGVDIVAPDLSDPIVYVAGGTDGLKTVDLSSVSGDPIAGTLTGAPVPVKTAAWPANTKANAVRVMGTTAVVAADPGLVLVDVSNPAAPSLVSASSPVFDLCLAGEMRPCARRALRLTLQGTLAYVATSTGLAVVDLSTLTAPKLLSAQTSGAIEDVAVSGHLAFLAAGAQGLSVVDITEPALPLTLPPLVDPSSVALNATITQAHGVQIGVLPTQTWLFVADGANGIRAVNVSALYDPYRDRPGSLSAPTGLSSAHAALTLERRDPFSPRDTTVPADHLAFPVVTFPTHAPARAIARGAMLDRIGDESGRRLRDSFNPGNSVLSAPLQSSLRTTQFHLP